MTGIWVNNVLVRTGLENEPGYVTLKGKMNRFFWVYTSLQSRLSMTVGMTRGNAPRESKSNNDTGERIAQREPQD